MDRVRYIEWKCRQMTPRDSLNTRRSLQVGGKTYAYFSLAAAEEAGVGPVSRLPCSLKVLLENLLRHEDGEVVSVDDIRALAQSATGGRSYREIALHPRSAARRVGKGWFSTCRSRWSHEH